VKPQITSILTILALLTSASLLANEPIQPIPTKAKVNELQSELGKKLYFQASAWECIKLELGNEVKGDSDATISN
jgi:hypothetical protein